MKHCNPPMIILSSAIFWLCACNNKAVFDPNTTANTLRVSNVPELMATSALTKNGNITVIIENGTYLLPAPIRISGKNVTFTSASTKSKRVIIKGQGMHGHVKHLFNIKGPGFKIRHISLTDASENAIRINEKADHIEIAHVRFMNFGKSMIDVKSTFKAKSATEYGWVHHCFFEQNLNSSPQEASAITIRGGQHWNINNCKFQNFSCKDGTCPNGVINVGLFSKNCTVENNHIINCDKGIIYGFDNEVQEGGIIRNNMIYVNHHAGIYLCCAQNVKVFNNTILTYSDNQNAIELNSNNMVINVEIVNNLSNKAITQISSSRIENNITNAQIKWFKNAETGNLCLNKDIPEVIDNAIDLAEVKTDIYGQERNIHTSDIGAYEH